MMLIFVFWLLGNVFITSERNNVKSYQTISCFIIFSTFNKMCLSIRFDIRFV